MRVKCRGQNLERGPQEREREAFSFFYFSLIYLFTLYPIEALPLPVLYSLVPLPNTPPLLLREGEVPYGYQPALVHQAPAVLSMFSHTEALRV